MQVAAFKCSALSLSTFSHTQTVRKALGVLLFQKKAKKSSLEANSVKENRYNKIKKKMRLNVKNSQVCSYLRGMGAIRHFPNMTSLNGSEVLDVTLKNGTCFIGF